MLCGILLFFKLDYLPIKPRIMKYQGLSFPLFACIAFVLIFLNSSHSGGNLSGACNSCHGSNTSANGSIILTGLPSSGNVEVNTTYSMQLCIVDPSKLAAGFRVETDLGTLISTDASTQTNASEDRITHTFPRAFGSPGNPACWDFDWTSPSAAPTEPSFTLRGNAVNANSSASGDNAGYVETSQGLPVEFASFQIEEYRQSVKVNWTTASEINNEKFIVQRSINNLQFENLAIVKSKGDSQSFSSYEYIDPSPPYGTLYYRILQVDVDGSMDYSSTRVIEHSNNLPDWTIYPNPIHLQETCIVNIENYDSDLKLLDVNGRVIRTYAKGTYEGFIDIGDHLSSGIYYLQGKNQVVTFSVLR